MKLQFLLASCVLIAGCSTTIGEMRGHAPSATYVSARSEAELEHCLAGNLSWSGDLAIIRGPDTTELSFNSMGSSVILVTLKPTATGTLVEARELIAYGVRVRNNIEACVTGRDR
jgi:hypothetical protein